MAEFLDGAIRLRGLAKSVDLAQARVASPGNLGVKHGLEAQDSCAKVLNTTRRVDAKIEAPGYAACDWKLYDSGL